MRPNYLRKKYKFLQSLDAGTVKVLKILAKRRGITLQEMIRAVIIPDWMRHYAKNTKIQDHARSKA